MPERAREPLGGPADRILHNGRILTMDAQNRRATAIAIRGESILAVGDEDLLERYRGDGVRIENLRGRDVLPGIIDGHAHMDREGLKGALPSLAGIRDIDSLVERLRGICAGVPPGQWVVTMPLGDPPRYRSAKDMFAEGRWPNRHDLDRASDQHPILIRSAWGYWSRQVPLVCIANSRALELAGIARSTRSPSSKVEIERDAAGDATGVIFEFDAMPIAEFTLFRLAPNFTLDDRVRTLGAGMQVYNRYGTTGVFEGHGAAPEVQSAYRRLREHGAGTTRAHLVFSPGWSRVSPVDVAEMLRSWSNWLAGKGLGDTWLRTSGIYTEIDDSEEGRLRARCAPQTGWAGFCYDSGLPRAAVRELMLEAARQGIRVCGIWENLFELFLETHSQVSIAGQRWVLGHQTFMDAGRITQARDMGLVLTTHTQMHKRGTEFLARAGPGREQTIYPFRTLLDAGIPVSLGTDNVPPSVFHSIWEVTERPKGDTGEVLVPEQRITREEALRCATANGAWLCFDERDRGTLEPGKLADLAVFDADLLTVAPEALRDMRSVLTMVNGLDVFRA